MHALDMKMERLKQDPENVGGYLSGRLHGCKSVRIIRTFRLVFRIDRPKQSVLLLAVDQRKHDRECFSSSGDEIQLQDKPSSEI